MFPDYKMFSTISVQFSGSEIGGVAQDVGISVYNVRGQQQILALRTYASWNLTSASKFASSPILRDVKQTHQILQPTERPSHGARTDSGLHASYFYPDLTRQNPIIWTTTLKKISNDLNSHI